jgi:hypothetical protein
VFTPEEDRMFSAVRYVGRIPESDAEIDGHFFAVLEVRDGRWWRGKEYADRSKAWAAFERRGATAHASRRN